MSNEKIALFFTKLQQSMADIPTIVGNEAKNYFLEQYKEQQWEGIPWEPRKDKKNNRPLLIRSRTLYRSIRVINTTANSVIIGTDVPYGRVHNFGEEISRAARGPEPFIRNRHTTGKRAKMFGGMGAFKKGTTPGVGQSYKAFNYRMPKRQFLGDTPELRRRVRQAVITELRLKLKG